MHQSTVPIVPRTLAAGGMDSCAGMFAILGLFAVFLGGGAAELTSG